MTNYTLTHNFSRGLHSMPAVEVTDQYGNVLNVLAITQAHARPDDEVLVTQADGTQAYERPGWTVWTWTTGTTGWRFMSGLTETEAIDMASSLTSRVA